MSDRTCGEVLVRMLEAYGIDTVFGIPGVHTVELYRGLGETGLHHVSPRHEQGAGFMADGYARAGARPAACFIITGPGLTNIATAMGQAFSDSVPMLVISSVNNRRELAMGEGRLHELPSQRDLVAGVAAFSHTLMHADELPEVLARAFAVFDGARPGPVHVEMPLDVITQPLALPADFRPRRIGRPGPDPRRVDDAARLLLAATRPVVILGGGAQDAQAPALAVVERLGAPAVTTINGKGILPPGHPLSLGSTLPQPPTQRELAAADVVLAVGTELGETDTLLFDRRLALPGRIVRVDIDPLMLTRNGLPEVGICSDAGLALQALRAALGEGRQDTAGAARAADLRAELDALITGPLAVHRRVMDTVQASLPGVAIVGDSTQPVYGANLSYEPARPRAWFNASTGYGTLGYALPAALGARLAHPDRPVVAVTGDGGLQFTIAELASGVELGLPLPVLLWNNRGYGEIKKYMRERQIPTIGVDIYTPDFQAVARGFGCHAAVATSLDELALQLREAALADAPTVIEIDEDTAAGW